MRAKLRGRCRPCGTAIEPGEEIEKFLGDWTHSACKGAEIQKRKQGWGPPVELEPALPPEGQVEYVGVRSVKRQSLRAFKRRKVG